MNKTKGSKQAICVFMFRTDTPLLQKVGSKKTYARIRALQGLQLWFWKKVTARAQLRRDRSEFESFSGARQHRSPACGGFELAIGDALAARQKHRVFAAEEPEQDGWGTQQPATSDGLRKNPGDLPTL